MADIAGLVLISRDIGKLQPFRSNPQCEPMDCIAEAAKLYDPPPGPAATDTIEEIPEPPTPKKPEDHIIRNGLLLGGLIGAALVVKSAAGADDKSGGTSSSCKWHFPQCTGGFQGQPWPKDCKCPSTANCGGDLPDSDCGGEPCHWAMCK